MTTLLSKSKDRIPLKIRRIPGGLLVKYRRWNKQRQINSLREEKIKNTQCPLSNKLHESIITSINIANKLQEVQTEHSSKNCFPGISELQQYWGELRETIIQLETLNPHDKYFNVETFDSLKSNGRKIMKDLFIMWLGKHRQPMRVLEIGTRTGASIVSLLAMHPKNKSCFSMLIDPFMEMGSPIVIKKNLQHLQIPTNNVHILTGLSESIIPNIPKEFPGLQFDYILVDGSHEEADALNDLHMITSLLAPRGYVVFDDIGKYSGKGYGLKTVWEKWKQGLQEEFVFREYEENYGFAVACKR
jgi:predicted O-methyltransferase YrrM